MRYNGATGAHDECSATAHLLHIVSQRVAIIQVCGAWRRQRPTSMSGPAKTDPELGSGEKTGPTGPRIRCPLCRWTPRPNDRWACTCGEHWNTFDTGGI